MDWKQVEARWKQAKRRIKTKWVRLTDEDLETIGGRRERLERKIQERYGFASSYVRKEIDDWVRWQGPVDRRRRKTKLASNRMRRCQRTGTDPSETAISMLQIRR